MKSDPLLLALGTNLGERSENLKSAIDRLTSFFGAPLSRSSIIETKACGFDGPDFLNTVIKYKSSLDPFEILSECKRIEMEMGRTDAPQYDEKGRRIYHNRIIDIDILSYGDRVLDTETLTLPHPQIKTRPYIAVLLGEIEGK